MTENNSPENAGDQDRREDETQDDMIVRLHRECRCPSDDCLETCEACCQLDPELDCLRRLRQLQLAGEREDGSGPAVVGEDWFVPVGGERPVCTLAWEGRPHDRHVVGPIDAPVHCPGLDDAEDDAPGYLVSLQTWEAENPWSARYGPLLHHARVLARKLDRDPAAPVALSSAYLQAITRLEKMRPASAGGAQAGDGLNPPGHQPDLFSTLEDED